ncbi:MAG: tetratricopeptide repeat protein [Gammaproteobacteria bacterium]|jgi:tetratricopeptide (TPR) repeat protein
MNRYILAFILAWLLVPAGSAADAIAEGDRLSAAGEWEEAIAAYRKAISEKPDSSVALTRLGGAMLARQRYSDSIGYFQEAISRDAGNHGAFIGLGISYLHMGRYDLSRAALQEARKLPSGKQEDIDRMLAWIDRKMAGDRHP